MVMQSDRLDEIIPALHKAQGAITGAKKTSKNPFFKSTYADLAAVWEAVRHALEENGLCITQTLDSVEGKDYLLTTLYHASGQWLRSRAPLVCAKANDPQAYGSAISYMRRYSLAAMLGVIQEDDDGEKAMPRNQPAAENDDWFSKFPAGMREYVNQVHTKFKVPVDKIKERHAQDPAGFMKKFEEWNTKNGISD